MRIRLSSLLALLTGASCAPSELPVAGTGYLTDVDDYVRRLAQAPEYGILIIEATGADRFINFSAADGEVQMTFPLITEIQRAREADVRSFCTGHAPRHEATQGTDGSRFLDCWLPGDLNAAAQIVRAALVTLLRVDDRTELTFRASGLAPSTLAP